MLDAGGRYLTGADGRAVFLRGVNLSGNAKLPFSPHCPSHVGGDVFFDSAKDVSFVNRPFPLEEADEHFSRLRSWGFNLLRFCVTWEALEHEGPGKFDYAFIDYVVAVLLKAKEYGFKVFMDPHQDVWSRFTGGSGAPAWTLELAGLDIRSLAKTGAAVVHNTAEKDAYPRMVWGTNYDKLACATMFTLFYGGSTFAPLLRSPEDPEKSFQDFLQDHYCAAIGALAQRIHDHGGLEDEVVLGWDTLNEPDNGWIGTKDLNLFSGVSRIGDSPTPFQGLLLGSGIAVDVEIHALWPLGTRKVGARLFDPNGASAWLPGSDGSPGKCLWARHGVWDIETKKLLKPDYFAKDPQSGKPVSFMQDFWSPFVVKFAKFIRAHHPNALVFIEPCGADSPTEPGVPYIPPELDSDNRIVFSPHWYDGLTLLNKSFNPWFSADFVGLERGKYSFDLLAMKIGTKGIRKTFYEQICIKRDDAGNHPTVIGETGIPMDFPSTRKTPPGAKRTYSDETNALDFTMRALDGAFVNFTLWNYTPTNSHAYGDEWNGEDLSIWSRDDVAHAPADSGLNAGARGLQAFCRPHARAVPGVPIAMVFEMNTGEFVFEFECTSETGGVVDFYVPKVHYPNGVNVKVGSGSVEIAMDAQEMRWNVPQKGTYKLKMVKK